ncbi:MAG: polysaccharide deacetylase family protein [Armatimonadetes bacterium]|nr:polysaccharide deacetylase family protein [Armatimonadota bacterium]MDW8026805.1 polysaccharide deacetylase family protein [Armatimonadota bacterium]
MVKVESPFPEGCVSAVSLTFDDGLKSQLEIAVPMLNDRNLKATFYLNPKGTKTESDDWLQRWSIWKTVAEQGHEIGNHSLTHPCSRALGESLDVHCLEKMTLVDIENDVLEAERRLRLLTGVEERTFAYPCYQDFVGFGPTRQSYVPVIAKHFVAARGRGEYPDNHPLTCDLHYLWSLQAEYMRGSEMIGWVEWTAQRGRWLIFTFHGIDEGHLPIPQRAIRELCDFLVKRRDIWVDTVLEVAKRIANWRKDIGVQ